MTRFKFARKRFEEGKQTPGNRDAHFCNFVEVKLEGLNVRGLQALGPLVTSNQPPGIIQRLIAISPDRGEWTKRPHRFWRWMKPEALAGIEHLLYLVLYSCVLVSVSGYS